MVKKHRKNISGDWDIPQYGCHPVEALVKAGASAGFTVNRGNYSRKNALIE